MTNVPSDSIIELARRLWGEPNDEMSTKSDVRFGSHGSKSVRPEKRTWYDHECAEGGGYNDLYEKVHGHRPADDSIVATYDYRDAKGSLLYQVVRKVPKTFRQRCPDGNGGWNWSTKGVRKVPYRLPELIRSPRDLPVFIVEGEKDCDALCSRGLTATTNPGGAGKWLSSMSGYLRGRPVVILPDNDDAGASHARDVHRKLFGIASSVSIINLPGIPSKGDVSDWLARGGTPEHLIQMADDAPSLEAPHEEPERAIAQHAPEEEPRPPAFTDESLALQFTDRHKDELRYVSAWGKWLIREPTVWRFEETMRAFDLSRSICREASAVCDNAKVASVVASARTVAAVERLAKADRRHAATVEQWDADPWLLNTPTGVVDLRTGALRQHQPTDYMTKITTVAPAGECPLWLAFLDKITGGDGQLQDFLQRAMGYALTGITIEHALFFGYGTGGNGKGVFVNSVSGIMGDYAAVAQMETFTASPHERHPADLAMLRGARLVTAQETEEGRHWAESRIKALTGGDKITARFMRQDFFSFIPSFKLFIAGNHKPGLRAVDEAIRRRLHLIPFEVKIPAVERDLRLSEKLKSEWAGILAWMIEGCLLWQQHGLAAPASVVAATEEYLETEDVLGTWLAECCQVGDYRETGSTPLYRSWKGWAERSGEFVGSQKRFTQQMLGRGFAPKRQSDGKSGFSGISLRIDPARTEPEHERE